MNDDLLGLVKSMVIDDPQYRLITFRKSLLLLTFFEQFLFKFLDEIKKCLDWKSLFWSLRKKAN